MECCEVLVAGAGVGGVCAALAAARTGAQVVLIERAPSIGGTGVHSPVSLICKFHSRDHRPINMGIHRELFFDSYRYSTWDKRATSPRLTYDERELKQKYETLLHAEPNITVLTGNGVSQVTRKGSRILSVTLDNGDDISADVFVDGTADGNLSAMADCEFQKGRSQDGKMQSSTLVFTMGEIDKSQLKIHEFSTRGGLHSLWAELKPYMIEAKERGETDNPRTGVLVFPYPDGDRLLFNSTAILDVDPTDEANVKQAIEKGKKQIEELVTIVKRHPAFKDAKVLQVANKLGVREGRRIVGDYMLTEKDCLSEARFDDMIAACSYELDIHNPEGGAARMVEIPGSGYYHIPYRCLVAKGCDNLLLGSRCISGTHEAHSSYRVMSGVSAIGQAAGTAAALAVRYTEGDVRAVDVKWTRFVLQEQLQFIEGEAQAPAGWDSNISR